MDLLSLRETLETLLVDQLGTYTLANGVTTPAISVRAVGELSPARTTVSGLECIIRREAQLTGLVQYERSTSFRSYTIFLVNWGDEDLGAAAEIVTRGFSDAAIRELTTLTVPQGQGPQDQMRLVLQFNPEPEEEP